MNPRSTSEFNQTPRSSNMTAVDISFPLFPIASLLAALMLLLVLTTSFIRQNWNLGVAFLCFWLLLDNLFNAVNAIIWSDNAVIRFYVYCDIGAHTSPADCRTLPSRLIHNAVTRVQMVAWAIRPILTLLITRQLYLVATMQPIGLQHMVRCVYAGGSIEADHRNMIEAVGRCCRMDLGIGYPPLNCGPSL